MVTNIPDQCVNVNHYSDLKKSSLKVTIILIIKIKILVLFFTVFFVFVVDGWNNLNQISPSRDLILCKTIPV